MHAIHRPHLPTAITVTLIAALLAVALTLAIASTLNDRAPSSVGATVSPATTQTSAPARGPSPFAGTPFSSLLPTPVIPAWAPNSSR